MNRRKAAGLLLLVPAALLLVFVFYVPMGIVLLQAMQGEAPPVPGAETGETAASVVYSFRRFFQLITDPYILGLIRFTAWQALLSTLLSIAVGLPLAYVLANRSFRGKAFVSALMMVPFVMPAVTVALGFLLMFGVNGWFNEGLHFLIGKKVRVLHTLWGVVLAHAFFNGPLVARMTQGAWERLDPALEESARTLGATPWAVWWHITFPAILPGLVSGALLAFVYCFMSFPIVLALGGARFSTLEVEIYTMIRVLLDYETGAALAAVQAVISLLFAYACLRVEGLSPVAFASGKARPTRPLLEFRRLSRDGWLLVVLLAAIIFFVGPVGSIVVDSLKGGDGGLSFDAYKRVLQAGYDVHLGGPPVRAIVNSVRFGLIAASIALLSGATFVYAMVRIVRRSSPVVEVLTMAPMAVSSVALAYGILLAFRKPPLNALSDDWRIPLIHAALAFPFVVRAFRPVLQGVHVELIEAARTLGASRWRAFVDVELPLALTGLVVAFALSFGLSVAETTAALMLSRPDQVTMPVSVYRFLASRDFTGAAAMAVLLMVVTGGVFFISEMAAPFLRRRRAFLSATQRGSGGGTSGN